MTDTNEGARMSVSTSQSPRRLMAAKLVKDGLTFSEIGRRMGISRQRVDQLVNGRTPKPRRPRPSAAK